MDSSYRFVLTFWHLALLVRSGQNLHLNTQKILSNEPTNATWAQYMHGVFRTITVLLNVCPSVHFWTEPIMCKLKVNISAKTCMFYVLVVLLVKIKMCLLFQVIQVILKACGDCMSRPEADGLSQWVFCDKPLEASGIERHTEHQTASL